MRVGFDGRSLASPAGGVRRYARELIRALAALRLGSEQALRLRSGQALRLRSGQAGYLPGLQLVVVGSPDDARLPESTERLAVRRVAPTNFGWSLVDLPRAVRGLRLDVFHAPAYTAPLRAVHPLVLTIHDVSYERHPEWYPYRRDPLRRWFYRRSALAADRIITDSEFSRAEIQAAYGIPSERIRVVPLGVGRPFAGDPADAPRRNGVSEPYLLHVGDLHRRRNLTMLVRALGRVRERRGGREAPPLVLVGADRGERARVVDEARRARVAVRFVAPPDDETLAQLYRGARAFVYPSRYEGFGLPLLEAMACGAPIVAARAASIPEVVADAGLLADPESDEDFAEAIARVLEDRALAERLREAGPARAATFTWDRTARETVEVYRDLAG